MSGLVRVYGQLSPLFVISSGVRQGCPISSFLFNFVVKDVQQNAFSGPLDGRVELLSGNSFYLEYAVDTDLLNDDAQAIQRTLDR